MEDFDATLKFLRKKFPCALPVRVRRVDKKPDVHGITYRTYGNKQIFEIYIVRGCITCMVATLLHEWAHARVWSLRHDHEEDPEFHDAAWGAEHARIYCAVYNTK
jgi:hypothetical protein